jgi:membrane-associated phospholipid phosphatase
MSFPDVKALECATEYGNPSGHAFLNCFFFVVFPWLYVPQIYTFTEKEQWRWMRIGAAAIIALWITWIALSRMYLGVHSLNQILLGIVYGLLSALLYVQLLAVRLEKFFCDIIFVDRNVRLRWLIISGGVSVACIAVTQGTFSIL